MNTSVKIPVSKIPGKTNIPENPEFAEMVEIDRLINKSINYEPTNIDKYNAEMLMYRFLSEVEIITEERKISKKELAKLVGTSPSYITQLYRGNKIASLEFLARLAKVLNIEFNIKVSTQTT